VLIEKVSSSGARNEHLRSSVRLNSRVPVMVEWMEDGQLHRESGVTMDVSPKGCLAIVPQGFAVGQKMRLVNKVTGLVSEAVLIWRGHEGRTGWELGLELQEPPADFWGVES
jgi:hypothetical protein